MKLSVDVPIDPSASVKAQQLQIQYGGYQRAIDALDLPINATEMSNIAHGKWDNIGLGPVLDFCNAVGCEPPRIPRVTHYKPPSEKPKRKRKKTRAVSDSTIRILEEMDMSVDEVVGAYYREAYE